MLHALNIHAGPKALAHIRQHGLIPDDIAMVPAAAGGPKGLVLAPLDQHLFGQWLPAASAQHRLHLVGASIGAWRMATALFPDPVDAFARLTQGYIHQHSEPQAKPRKPSPSEVSAQFAGTLADFFGTQMPTLLSHPRWSLHIVTSRGQGLLRQAGRWRNLAGFGGLVVSNAVSRQGVGRWLERTVFSSGASLPLDLRDQPTTAVALTEANFMQAMRASCSIPFWLDPVTDIPGSPRGAHWDGGLIDYHFHWPYHQLGNGLVLYPHFQRQVIPGWLDKRFKRRHRPTPWLDNLIVLAPKPAWVAGLPQGRLPDRNDFIHMSGPERVRSWGEAVARSQALADDWQSWLSRGCPADQVQAL